MTAKKKSIYGRGQNPNSRANLGIWQPGVSANPAGRPKGIQSRSDVLRRFMDVKIDVADPSNKGGKLKVSVYEAAALGQFQSAMKGNTNAWKEIQDSLFGKQTEKTETFTFDLSRLTDEQFAKFDELTEQGIDARVAYAACIAATDPGGEASPNEGEGEGAPGRDTRADSSE